MDAAVLEANAGGGHKVPDRPRDEDLARLCRRCDASRHVDGHAAHLAADDLALAHMQPGPNLDAELRLVTLGLLLLASGVLAVSTPAFFSRLARVSLRRASPDRSLRRAVRRSPDSEGNSLLALRDGAWVTGSH